MEIKINLLNLEDAKNGLDNLENELNVKNSALSDCMVLIKISSGGACDEVNEIYRSLKRIEGTLSKLIETTKICVNNGKVVAAKTDTQIGNIFQDTYSGCSLENYLNIGNKPLLNK